MPKGKLYEKNMKKFFCIQWRKESDPELDPDPDPLVRGTAPDPHQNVTDPQHCLHINKRLKTRVIKDKTV